MENWKIELIEAIEKELTKREYRFRKPDVFGYVAAGQSVKLSAIS